MLVALSDVVGVSAAVCVVVGVAEYVLVHRGWSVVGMCAVRVFVAFWWCRVGVVIVVVAVMLRL
eukprot:7952135-Prorocentrum_lima.AAC.1